MRNDAVFLFLTDACNLACRHCYVSASPSAHNHMSPLVLEHVVDTFRAAGVSDFRLTGGEPTVHPSFDQILTFMNNKSLKPRLITNGINLMASKDPWSTLSRVGGCWISAYGTNEITHRRVGGGACKPLREILAFTGDAIRRGFDVGLSVLLNQPYNDLYEFAVTASENGIDKIRFLLAEPRGRAKNLNLIVADWLPQQETIKNQIGKIQESKIGHGFRQLTFNDPHNILRSTASGESSCLLHKRAMWSVIPDGRVYSCCFNVYRAEHYAGMVSSLESSRDQTLTSTYSSACEALKSGWWGTSQGSCPLAAVDIR